MSKIVHTPVIPHSCAPGWTWTKCTAVDALIPGIKGSHYGTPPTSWDYPKGTVWECDCGRTWVSTGPPAANMRGLCWFRPEGWFARRRRERRNRASGHMSSATPYAQLPTISDRPGIGANPPDYDG